MINSPFIKKCRIDQGLTQQQVADKLGISQANYARREAGKISFKLEEIESLAEMFGQAIGNFLRSDIEPQEGGTMTYWEKEYYKLLGKYEMLLDMMGPDTPFRDGVGSEVKMRGKGSSR